MLTYNLTATGSDSLYESLYKCIKNDILQGKLCAGEKLPSKRSFAKNLGISVITVENAYGQLSDEGYIYSMPKRGFYVSDIDMVVARGINMKGISKVQTEIFLVIIIFMVWNHLTRQLHR